MIGIIETGDRADRRDERFDLMAEPLRHVAFGLRHAA
jgi:hypothetical protein